MATNYLAAGDVLGGRYVLRRSAWTTPLGPVWQAHDRVLQRSVFVQLLGLNLATDAGVRKRFATVAAAYAQVADAALSRIFDIGDEPPFVVFEHADGGRLSDRLARGALRTNEATRAALSIARGVEALHAAGLAHGSLAPTSVLFDAEGRAQVMAIGAAQTTAPIPTVDATAEQPPGYRPPDPEVDPIDADRYALAALVHHMLTGKPPGAGSPRRMLVPGPIAQMLARALGPDPAARPPMDTFIRTLAPFARVEPSKAHRPRTLPTEFRWLIPAVVIIALAVVALTFGLRLVQELGEDEPEQGSSPSPTTVAGEPVVIQDAAELDPHGSGQEHPDLVAMAFDGDRSTQWRTLNYVNRGFDKPGVGLLFDLGEARPVARIDIITGLPGWEAEIRVGDTAGDDETAFDRVASFRTDGEETSVELPPGTRARYVLLWITDAAERPASEVEDNLRYRAEVNEVTIVGA